MVSVAIIDHNNSTTDATNFTPTATVGAGGAERTFFIGGGARAVGTGITNSGITVAGVAAGEVVKSTVDVTGGRSHMAGIYVISAADLPDPAAISLALNIAFSATVARMGWWIAVTSDPIDITAFDTNSGSDATAPGGINLPLDIPEGGFALGAAFSDLNSSPDFAWTNLTESYEDGPLEAAGGMTAAAASDMTAASALAISLATTVGAPVAVVASFAPAGDVTAPVLSNPTATATGETTADLSADTDEGNGTLFWVVTTSASPPSGAQVAAGQDHTGAAASDSGSQSVSGTGTQNANATGLSAGTTYWAHFVQDDAAANRSDVASSASFATDAAPASTTSRWQQRGGVALNEEQREYWRRMREGEATPVEPLPQREAPPPPKTARKAKSKPSEPQREAVDGRVLESVKKTVSKLEQRKRREQEDDDEGVLLLIA